MPVRRPPKHEIPVVILCGGQGTRLREETSYRPKPMVEIGGNPILWHIMKTYGHFGHDRFVLCLGYLGWEIKQYFLRYREYLSDFTIDLGRAEGPVCHDQQQSERWRVTCAETGAETATGARIWRVRRYLDVDTFLCTYGDGVADIDLDALLDFHFAAGRHATVTGVHPTSRFGEMTIEGGRAVEFNEKPTVAGGVVSGGFFVFNRQAFDYFDDDPGLFLELGPLPRLARDGQLSVYLHEGFWHSMDTYRDYLALNKLWASGKAPWKVWKG
jgi:glucose-1-phosphate cytidylyltransferase